MLTSGTTSKVIGDNSLTIPQCLPDITRGELRHVGCMKTLLASLLLCAPLLQAADKIPNQLIDYARFQKIAREVQPVREKRRVTEEQFAAKAADADTLILDARSADKYALRHIRGAVAGLVAGVIGDGRIFVSGGAEHQGPDGGGLIAVIASQQRSAV